MSNPSEQAQGSEDPNVLINPEDGRKYWEGIEADVNGMLGGFAHISKVDLQGSRNFLAKLGIGARKDLRTVASALEGGAGIGRITEGLLTDVAQHVDVVEPVAKFTAGLREKSGVRNIYTSGLEAWQPVEGVDYDLIWVQWCIGHLNDDNVVAFLERCKKVLKPNGVVVIKENNNNGNDDIFDDVDSSVTRADPKFRSLFEKANYRLVQTELQRGFPRTAAVSLFPVRMYALKPK
ncbi:S-adenosylmethionine-dependent methyltransferase-like protein [Bombardia bombarda]|uniref:Alpha N-terminal protein methyltransferase 1 n=1 Tax=Bombardia bombarda TaxID=252184 RepID=A0AA39XM03_9PEZI|nr:S-adenosylmethionine-dependent methyltransferase-like protein [Bombardia bombarda]